MRSRPSPFDQLCRVDFAFFFFGGSGSAAAFAVSAKAGLFSSAGRPAFEGFLPRRPDFFCGLKKPVIGDKPSSLARLSDFGSALNGGIVSLFGHWPVYCQTYQFDQSQNFKKPRKYGAKVQSSGKKIIFLLCHGDGHANAPRAGARDAQPGPLEFLEVSVAGKSPLVLRIKS
jgi:hypothetical protein